MGGGPGTCRADARARRADLGIVGMGTVGRAVAAIARHGFGLRVLGTNRSGSVLPEGVERATLEELARRATSSCSAAR